ncbi:VOC family protein [Kribbella sp. NPDC049174]|uniref:VOC family protein n=1 Tax=Kribbella sp. NPDC049174 TaxID=3364112 RepID=UPI0037165F15
MSESIAGAEDWRALASGTYAWFEAPSQTTGAALVARIAGLTDLLEVNLRDRGVQVRIDGSSGLELASAISAAAKGLGLTADPSALQDLRVRIGAADRSAVIPFWHAVLGYETVGDDQLADPLRRDPAFSFHQLDESLPLRNRPHVDVCRPQTLTAGVTAAEAAGGRVAFDGGDHYRTMADAEGNEADIVSAQELAGGPETADWRTAFGGMTFYPTTSTAQAAELATAVAGLVDETGMALMVDLRPDGVTIDTGKDLWEDARFADLARRVQAAARDLKLTADPSRLRFVQFGIDAVDIAAVRTFWQTVLGYDPDTRPYLSDIYDPRWLNPVLFFQPMDPSDEARRAQRNRITLELLVPGDQLQNRIETALATGGRIVHQDSPQRCTLADPENNELDLVTTDL